MKKIVSFFVAATFAVALTSCGSKPAETTETEATETVTAEPVAEPTADMNASSETTPAEGATGTETTPAP